MTRLDDTLERPSSRAPLPATSWTLLAEATSDHGDAARNELVARYYRPVRAYLGAIVRDSERTDELTQAFFEQVVLSGRLLRAADRQRGTFRALLKQALRNFVTDDHRRRQVATRRDVHPDGDTQGWDAIGDDVGQSAELDYHQAWVRALLDLALARVREACLSRGQEAHYQLFTGRYLSGSGVPPSWRELGAPLGIDEKAARNRTETVARHFRLVLRRMLIEETGSPGGAAAEAAALLEML
jgi:DNA-directed RNA polymerase specialized sigma24 family protein